jgi:hypothetical protein
MFCTLKLVPEAFKLITLVYARLFRFYCFRTRNSRIIFGIGFSEMLLIIILIFGYHNYLLSRKSDKNRLSNALIDYSSSIQL